MLNILKHLENEDKSCFEKSILAQSAWLPPTKQRTANSDDGARKEGCLHLVEELTDADNGNQCSGF